MDKKLKNNGITLISLVITIIVMLILVGVSITLAVNGGLFNYAGNAVGDTKNAMKNEGELGTGSIIEQYVYGISEEVSKLPAYSEELLDEETKVLTTNAKYISGNYVAVIPKGFKVSEVDGEKEIDTGLVIQDAKENEFVWIPVDEDLENQYTYLSDYKEPKALKYKYESSDAELDSQTTLTRLYGNKFNYDNDFKYEEEYKDMVTQVNKYGGFYIGRYETTIDEDGKIGSKYDTKVLTGADEFTNNDESYCYRWYGFYYFQKKANVTGNVGNEEYGKNGWVQTAMIYGQLWDKTMEYIKNQKAAGKTKYNVEKETSEWHDSSTGEPCVEKSGQANKTTVGVDGTIGDVALNIWDLESNAYEWTQEAAWSSCRVLRGGCSGIDGCASNRTHSQPFYPGTRDSSRLILYIK